MFNEVIMVGKLVEKPKMEKMDNGTKYSTIILDIERPFKNNQGGKDHDYIHCVLWQGISHSVNDCCDIGSFLGVKGRLQSQSINSPLEVKVEHIVFLDKYLKNS